MNTRFLSCLAPKLAATVSLLLFSGVHSQSAVEAWVQRYSHPAGTSAYARTVVTDKAGNVIVAGYTAGQFTGDDFLVVKYSGAGVPLWTNRYSGPGNAWDQAFAVAVDGSGRVFVTGSSATIAYSGVGGPLWTNSGSGSAIAVDGNGKVFVTGSSATIAYSGAGVPLWTNIDSGTAIAVDGSGNVFVTGKSSSGSSFDYATVAYSGAGVPLWTNRYNGPFNDADQALAIAVDGSGNVFVTGESVGDEFNSDYATIAYSGAGAPLWTNRYSITLNGSDVAYAAAVDSSGNVFVTGESKGARGYDFATLAYSAAGAPLWTNRCRGAGGNGDSQPAAVAVDGSGNVFVTGSSFDSVSSVDYATVAYSSAGVPLWINRFNGPGNRDDLAAAMVVDRNGNVFVTGSSAGIGSVEYATVAYSGAGVPMWTNRYVGYGYNQATAIGVDSSGNVFVTGRSYTFDSSFDFVTVAYSGAGVPLWTNRYNGPANDYDGAYAIAVDRSGNVFVTGSSAVGPEDSEYATVAYSGAGVPLWTNRYTGPVNDANVARAIAVDGNGNVFVTGSSYGTAGFYDYATVAYSGAGVPLWTNRYDGPDSDDDEANAIAVDSSGNVFVTGSSDGAYATVAYSGAGVPLWTNRYSAPANGHDRPLTKSCLAVGPDGAVYVTGASDAVSAEESTAYDYATIKYVSTPPVRLNFQIVGNQLVLSWTNAAFRLQSAPAVQGEYTDVSGATSPHSTSFSGPQRYFQLKAD